MPFQKRAVFVLKCQPLVLFPLPLNVSPHRSCVGLRYSERPITALPTKPCKRGSLSFDPPRGGPFDTLDGAAQCDGPTEFKKDVDMIFYRIDRQHWGPQIPQHGYHVSMQRRSDLITQKPLPVLGCKHQMNCHLCQRMGHAYGIVTRDAVRRILNVPRWGARVWGRRFPTALPSHGVAIPRRCHPTTLPWAARSVPRWGARVRERRDLTALPSHRVVLNGPSCLTCPIRAWPFRTHRRCISLASPWQRRGKTVPNRIRSPTRGVPNASLPYGHPTALPWDA